MKNISLRLVIIASITLSMLLFSVVFTLQSYLNVKTQLNVLHEDKIHSIVSTITPIIAINMTLELKSAYEEAIEQLLISQPMIVKIELTNADRELLYKSDTSSYDEKREYLKSTQTIYDQILGLSIGEVVLYYDTSDMYKQILGSYKTFLIVMFFASLLLILFLAIFIEYTLKPLKKLTVKLAKYTPNKAIEIEYIDGKNETAVINNTIKDMLQRIEQYNSQLRDKERMLAQQSKLASMGEMIENIAHQWRQPLMSINSVLISLDREFELAKMSSEHFSNELNEISKLTNYMSHTIEDFKNFIKEDKDKKEFVLFESIDKVLALLKVQLKDVHVKVEVAKDIKFLSYESEFIQVFISILNNSIDMFILRDIKEKKLSVRVEKSAKEVRILLEDSAGGISDKNIDRIFEPYFTTKHQSHGTGLGLYITKLILENSLAGTVGVENTDIGAKFIITLPLHVKN